ncbi:MAG: HDOD domain-containing protein [Thermodesulfobacteriota bacterium]
MRRIEQIIERIENLQPFSQIGNRIIEISNDPACSSSDLAKIIKYDQGITANLLKICNSSYFGFKKKVTSIKQAVAYLGVDQVVNLIVMEKSAANFNGSQTGYDLKEGELWRYSVSSAIIAQHLAEKKKIGNVSLVFTSALLKDIGKLILHTYVNESFGDIMRLVQERGFSFREAEEKIIGIDHAELGAQVAERWNFNPATVNIIRYHHDPHKAPSKDLVIPIIYLADSICMMTGIGVGSDGLAYRYYQDVVNQLGLSEVDFQETIAAFMEKLKGVEELFASSGGN